MTKIEREHIAMMVRRKEYLQERLDQSRRELVYDRRERDALVWAIEKLKGEKK